MTRGSDFRRRSPPISGGEVAFVVLGFLMLVWFLVTPQLVCQ